MEDQLYGLILNLREQHLCCTQAICLQKAIELEPTFLGGHFLVGLPTQTSCYWQGSSLSGFASTGKFLCAYLPVRARSYQTIMNANGGILSQTLEFVTGSSCVGRINNSILSSMVTYCLFRRLATWTRLLSQWNVWVTRPWSQKVRNRPALLGDQLCGGTSSVGGSVLLDSDISVGGPAWFNISFQGPAPTNIYISVVGPPQSEVSGGGPRQSSSEGQPPAPKRSRQAYNRQQIAVLMDEFTKVAA